MNEPPPPEKSAVLAYADPAVRRGAPLWWRLGLTVACLYLPYAWLLKDGPPWRDYRWYWIKMWPILPGLTGGLVLHPHVSEPVLRVAMGAMAAAVVGLFLYLAARSRWWVPIPTFVALALSIFNSWIAWGVYHS